MAVFPPFFPNLVEVRCEQTLPGNVDAVNVLFVERNGAGTFIDEADEIILTVIGFFSAFNASLHTTWSLDEIRCIDRSVASGPERIDFAPGVAGLLANHSLPTQTTMCVTWRTANSGRRYRGRTNLSGWTEGSNDDDGDINSAARGTVLTAAENLLAGLVSNGHSLQILSRGNTSPPAPAAWTAFHTEVTSAAVNREWDVLRSRRR